MPPTPYATQADVEAYEPGVDLTGVDVAALLLRATLDVDRLLGARGVRTTGVYAGLKLDPTRLRTWERDALARTTAAQAIHLLAGFKDGTYAPPRPVQSASGPDFSVTYAAGDARATGTGLYSPRIPTEIAPIEHLRRLTARVG